jgi:quercetin dioxygenase-like cupin family protein
MEHVRHFDVGSLAPDAFDFAQLADLESCLVLAVRTPPGKAGPAHHVHEGDQLYYVLAGEMHLVLGDEEHLVGAGGVAFIAQGTPHHNWNAAEETEIHLDLIIPPPVRGTPLSRPTSGEGRPGTSFVRRLEESDFGRGRLPGHDVATLVSPTLGSSRITLEVARREPTAVDPDWHVHEFDHLSYVLEGTLTIEVANHRAEAGPDHLVVVPAGVPHRTWNAGPGMERHIAFVVPAPTEERLDVAVRFEVLPRS